jgi:hypothetical protein
MAAEFSALVAGDANAFEQLCAMLMSSQNEQRSQVRRGMAPAGACTQARCSRAAAAAGGGWGQGSGVGLALPGGAVWQQVEGTAQGNGQSQKLLLWASIHCSRMWHGPQPWRTCGTGGAQPPPLPACPTPAAAAAPALPNCQCVPGFHECLLQADAVFAELKKHPDACAQQLIRSLRASPSLEARGLCAVLLRKVLTRDDASIWPGMSAPVKEVVKTEMLNCIKEEQMRAVTKKVWLVGAAGWGVIA